MRTFLILITCFLTLSPAARATPAGIFIERWRAVSRPPVEKGVSPDTVAQRLADNPEFKALIREFHDALQRYSAEIRSSRSSGRAARSCPPPGVEVVMDDMLERIERLPTEWRDRELSDAFGAAMDAQYPCGTAS
ncbi:MULTISPECIES: hypothetical protein [unclassified Sphingomonas]|jgi:hypothetical protein|uniref:hypothetical protein n=1 Tax=unclassified Sphingomonas TaxID=196159 RepID=UPI0012E3BC72|nr:MULTISPECIES: hypothetical protein [unclassified Sphingomonas]